MMEIVFVGLALLSIAVACGFLFEGVERKLFARFQNRKGPPVLQPLYDALKLLFVKETVIPVNASTPVFIIAPYVSVAAVITAVLLIPLGGAAPPLAFSGDLIVLVYVLALSTAALFLGASASGSPFAALGASREMTLYISLELSLALAILAPAFAADSFSMTAIYSRGAFLPLAAIVFFVAALAELGKKPFDISEAEQEIAEGLYAEYSGRLLGMFKIANALKHYVYASVFAALFIPIPMNWPIEVKVAAQLASAFIFICTIAFVRGVSARTRIHGASRFYMSLMAVLALIQILLVYLWR